MTTKKGTKTRKKKDAEPFEGLRASTGGGSDKWYGGARERVIALKGEALAPIADEYREMVKSVLNSLQEELYTMASVEDDVFYWRVRDNYRISTGNVMIRKRKDYVKVELKVDKQNVPTHFRCTYWKPYLCLFGARLPKKRDSGLTRKELVKTLEELHKE